MAGINGLNMLKPYEEDAGRFKRCLTIDAEKTIARRDALRLSGIVSRKITIDMRQRFSNTVCNSNTKKS